MSHSFVRFSLSRPNRMSGTSSPLVSALQYKKSIKIVSVVSFEDYKRFLFCYDAKYVHSHATKIQKHIVNAKQKYSIGKTTEYVKNNKQIQDEKKSARFFSFSFYKMHSSAFTSRTHNVGHTFFTIVIWTCSSIRVFFFFFRHLPISQILCSFFITISQRMQRTMIQSKY